MGAQVGSEKGSLELGTGLGRVRTGARGWGGGRVSGAGGRPPRVSGGSRRRLLMTSGKKEQRREGEERETQVAEWGEETGYQCCCCCYGRAARLGAGKRRKGRERKSRRALQQNNGCVLLSAWRDCGSPPGRVGESRGVGWSGWARRGMGGGWAEEGGQLAHKKGPRASNKRSVINREGDL